MKDKLEIIWEQKAPKKQESPQKLLHEGIDLDEVDDLSMLEAFDIKIPAAVKKKRKIVNEHGLKRELERRK